MKEYLVVHGDDGDTWKTSSESLDALLKEFVEEEYGEVAHIQHIYELTEITSEIPKVDLSKIDEEKPIPIHSQGLPGWWDKTFNKDKS